MFKENLRSGKVQNDSILACLKIQQIFLRLWCIFLEDGSLQSEQVTFLNQECHEVGTVVNFVEGKSLDSWTVRQEVIQ